MDTKGTARLAPKVRGWAGRDGSPGRMEYAHTGRGVMGYTRGTVHGMFCAYRGWVYIKSRMTLA